MALALALLGMGFGLSACAVETLSYPTLSTAKKLKDRILSREEQEEVIRDLSAEQAKHETSAIDTIEKSNSR